MKLIWKFLLIATTGSAVAGVASAQTPAQLEAPSQYKTPIAYEAQLQCGPNETFHKARRSHPGFGLGGSNYSGQGNLSFSTGNRITAIFERQSFPTGLVSKARFHIFSEPDPTAEDHRDAHARLGTADGFSSYGYGPNSFNTSQHWQNNPLSPHDWTSALVPHAIWKYRSMTPAQLQTFNDRIVSGFNVNQMSATLYSTLGFHVVLETCHAPEGVDPFAPGYGFTVIRDKPPISRPLPTMPKDPPRKPPKT